MPRESAGGALWKFSRGKPDCSLPSVVGLWNKPACNFACGRACELVTEQPCPSPVQRPVTDGLKVIEAIDQFCRKEDEWMMNVGDQKGPELDAIISRKLTQLGKGPVTFLELGTCVAAPFACTCRPYVKHM